MSQYPPLDIVDGDDNIIGSARLGEIHAKGLIHRVALIVIWDENGRILLQRRGANVATNANRWDVSAAGYVDKGEAYDTAAQRELNEELGISVDLAEIDYYFSDRTIGPKQLKRFVKLYIGVTNSSTDFKTDKNELSAVKWFSLSEARALFKHNPEEFNNDFDEVLGKLEAYYENH